MTTGAGNLLEAEEISVRFGGIHALDSVSMHVADAAMVGLIGPNGAGKSTLLGVLSGLLRPNRGRVYFRGEEITTAAPHRRAALGMSRTFQRLELWGSMTVLENIATAAEFATRWQPGLRPSAVSAEIVELLGLGDVAATLASTLPSGLGRVVELARALASKPRLLLLDEPSAGLDHTESEDLARKLVGIASAGTSILLVEHHVDMVLGSCSDVWVLDFGRFIAHGPPSLIRADPAVQAAYLGTKHAGVTVTVPAGTGTDPFLG
jgi:branched-chain amino acid transport system ATP-binding protein